MAAVINPKSLDLADPRVEPTQRDWQRLTARSMHGVRQRHQQAMRDMLTRLDAEILKAEARAQAFEAERRAA